MVLKPYFFSVQSAQCLHGDIVQKQREITLKGFRNGTFEVLVATNVAARGLDIPEVDLVVQCSPPKVRKAHLFTTAFDLITQNSDYTPSMFQAVTMEFKGKFRPNVSDGFDLMGFYTAF